MFFHTSDHLCDGLLCFLPHCCNKKVYIVYSGKRAIHDNGGMLSLEGTNASAQPAAIKFSLLDLAEAADQLSQEQLGARKGAKLGKQNVKQSRSGPMSAQEHSKTDTTKARSNAAPSSAAAMLTRTQLRQQGSNLHEAILAADATPTFSASVADKTHGSEHAGHAEPQPNAEQHTATLLPNGEVLRHLPVSQRGIEKSAPDSKAASKQKQSETAAGAASGQVKSASAHLHAAGNSQKAANKPTKGKQKDVGKTGAQPDSSMLVNAGSSARVPGSNAPSAQHGKQVLKPAEAPANIPAKKAKSKCKRQEHSHTDLTATAQPVSDEVPATATATAIPSQQAGIVSPNAEAIPGSAQPLKKQKKQKHDKEVSEQAAAPLAAEAAAAAADADPTSKAPVAPSAVLAGSTARQRHELAEGGSSKGKKRKHKSKEQTGAATLPADAQQAGAPNAVVQPDARGTPTAQADLRAPVSSDPAAKPKKKKKKDKKRVRSAAADPEEPEHAVPSPVAIWPSSQSVPAEPALADQPAEATLADQPVEPALTYQAAEHALTDEPAEPSRKPKKRRRTQPQLVASNQPEPAAVQPSDTPSTAAIAGGAVEPVSAVIKQPVAKAKRARTPRAAAGSDATLVNPPSHVTEQPAVRAKHASKSEPAADSDDTLDERPSAASKQPVAKAKRGRKPNATNTPDSAGTEAGAPKARRGRPRKSATSPGAAAASEASGMVPTSWREGEMHTSRTC